MLRNKGKRSDSRNGPVLVMPGPVTTIFEKPWEHVLTYPGRNANPFFHFMESMWMLAGRRDVAPMDFYVKNMKNYSDDGDVFHGAYGYRWRHHFCMEGEEGEDQIIKVINELSNDPNSRRAVLTMWDPVADLNRQGKDFPCNTHIYFRTRENGATHFLDMTVLCRSNDIIWGLYGSNAVHFSVLLEYLAGALGMLMGRYYHVSNNYHAYVDVFDKYVDEATGPLAPKQAEHIDLFENHSAVQVEINRMINHLAYPGEHPYPTDVSNLVLLSNMHLMHWAYTEHKKKDYSRALQIVRRMAFPDWREACTSWLTRKVR